MQGFRRNSTNVVLIILTILSVVAVLNCSDSKSAEEKYQDAKTEAEEIAEKMLQAKEDLRFNDLESLIDKFDDALRDVYELVPPDKADDFAEWSEAFMGGLEEKGLIER